MVQLLNAIFLTHNRFEAWDDQRNDFHRSDVDVLLMERAAVSVASRVPPYSRGILAILSFCDPIYSKKISVTYAVGDFMAIIASEYCSKQQSSLCFIFSAQLYTASRVCWVTQQCACMMYPTHTLRDSKSVLTSRYRYSDSFAVETLLGSDENGFLAVDATTFEPNLYQDLEGNVPQEIRPNQPRQCMDRWALTINLVSGQFLSFGPGSSEDSWLNEVCNHRGLHLSFNRVKGGIVEVSCAELSYKLLTNRKKADGFCAYCEVEKMQAASAVTNEENSEMEL